MDLFFEELVICQLTILGQFHVTAKEITPLKHASMEKLNKVFFDKKRKKKKKNTDLVDRPHVKAARKQESERDKKSPACPINENLLSESNQYSQYNR